MRAACGWIAIVVAAVALGGCSALFDDAAVKLCRSIVPAFYAEATRIDVLRTERKIIAQGTLVTVVYRQGAAGDATPRHALSCIVKRDPAAGGAITLTNLATEDGALGDVRLHLLRRYWIESGRAANADPMPVTMLRMAPEVPRAMAGVAQHLASALPSIAIYVLLAAAYALIYGLVGRINLAFGELAMLAGYGAFLGYALAGGAGQGLLAVGLGLGLGIATAAAHGAALGRYVFQPLLQRPGQHVLIATVGLSLVWSELVRLAQGPGNRWMAPLMHRPIGILRSGELIVTVTPVGLMAAAVAAVAAMATVQLLRRSRFGRAWRATADDALAASLMAIDPARVVTQTMLLAALLAGLGGMLTTLVYGGVGLGGGLVVGLKALIAAVIGGIGSVPGAMAGALLLGLGETIWSALFAIEFRDAALFAALAVLLALKPDGLFGGEGRSSDRSRSADM